MLVTMKKKFSLVLIQTLSSTKDNELCKFTVIFPWKKSREFPLMKNSFHFLVEWCSKIRKKTEISCEKQRNVPLLLIDRNFFKQCGRRGTLTRDAVNSFRLTSVYREKVLWGIKLWKVIRKANMERIAWWQRFFFKMARVTHMNSFFSVKVILDINKHQYGCTLKWHLFFIYLQTPEALQNGLPSFLSEEESQPKAPGSPTVIITDADGAAHTVVSSTTPTPGSAVNVWESAALFLCL